MALVAVALGYPAWTAYQIWQQSREDELPFNAAGAIVVMGAAQYDGAPSPIFRARLDHAKYLYDEGYSPTIVVTGGKRPGDRFTEAEAGASYLASAGVPRSAIARVAGRTTLGSLRQVAEVAEERDLQTILLVSDPLHSERIKRMALDLGFGEAFTSPASYTHLDRSRETKFRELLRETGSLLVYELLER